MAEFIQYKCPCCGGSIEFNSTEQKMKCPYCDTEFDINTLKAYDEELKKQPADDMSWESQPDDDWTTSDHKHLCLHICDSCGGEIIGDENTAATVCPYCDTPIIVKKRLSGMLKPDYVIPFKLDKKAAKENFKKHLMGKRLLPKVFKDENHIDEIRGMYVPFWLFDADATANMIYRGTKIHRWSDSKYDYTETKFYSITREGTIRFELVPVDGSSKMEDDLMESIEPFDFSEAVEFQTAYLASYVADKYDVAEDVAIKRANQRIRQSTEDSFISTVRGYVSVTKESGSVQLQNGKAKYVLYPVWILNTTWNGQKYRFAMNGQTGKFIGDLPLDKNAYTKWLFGLTGIISAVTFIISYLVWLL